MAAVLALVVLAGCGGASGSVPAESPEPAAAADLPQEPGLPYDEIRPIAELTSTPNVIIPGYFTVSKDGQWGVIRADGVELVPCEGMAPVSACSQDTLHWIWERDNDLPWEDEFDYIVALSDRLREAGEPELCPGHTDTNRLLIYDLSDPDRDPDVHTPDAVKYYISYEGEGHFEQLPDEMWETYGDPLPVYNAYVREIEGEPLYIEYVQEGDRCFYLSRDGQCMTPSGGAQEAGFFFGEALAPVQNDDGKWYYIDRSGQSVTGAVYDPVFDCENYWEPGEHQPLSAACLRNGYAVVRRGARYGLLDSSGAEVIPCDTAGLAWDGTALWYKTETGWYQRELP